MTTHTITLAQLADLRPGDRITHFDDREVGTFTVTKALHVATGTGVKAVEVRREGRAEPFNMYADTLVADTITFERTTVTAVATERRNLTHIKPGDRVIVVRCPDGTLASTRRKTCVEVVTVLTNNLGGGWRCRTLTTTGGDIFGYGSEVYGITA